MISPDNLMPESTPPPVPRLLEVAHVAFRISYSQEYVRVLIRRGQLAAVRIGRQWRIDPADLQRWIDAQRVASREDEREDERRCHPRAKPS